MTNAARILCFVVVNETKVNFCNEIAEVERDRDNKKNKIVYAIYNRLGLEWQYW